jgi:hypothetical protein
MRLTIAAAACALLGLSSCADTNPAPTVAPLPVLVPIRISPVQVHIQAAAALAVIEGATIAYMATNPVPPDVAASISATEDAAEALVAAIPTKAPTDLPQVAADVLRDVQIIMAALPPGALPPAAEASVTALSILSAALPALLQAAQPPPSAP